MKVLWINPIYLGYRESYYNELGRKVELVVARSESRRGRENITPDHYRVLSYRERIFEIPRFGFNLNQELSNRFYRFTFSFNRYILVYRESPDIVILEGMPFSALFVGLYAKIARIGFYVTNERTRYTERNQGLKMHYRKFVLSLVDGVLVNGHESKSYVLSLRPKMRNFILGQLSNDVPKLKYIVEGSTIARPTRWLYVGKLNYRKGVSNLFKTWKKWRELHPEHTLVVIGSNGGGIRLENFPGVNYLGIKDENVMPEYYRRSDVLIMPTLEDNWSMTVVEALSQGCRVITTHQNGNSLEFGELEVVYTFDGYSDMGLFEKMLEVEAKIGDDFPAKNVFDLLTYFSHEQAVNRLLKGLC